MSHNDIDTLLQHIDFSHEKLDRNVAIAAGSSLLSKVAENESNKNATAQKRGFHRLIDLASGFTDDPCVLGVVILIIAELCWKSPHRAALAVEVGAPALAIQAMEDFPDMPELQRNACFMVQSLTTQSREYRCLFHGTCIETLIRTAAERHFLCRDAAAATLEALRLDTFHV